MCNELKKKYDTYKKGTKHRFKLFNRFKKFLKPDVIF